MKYSSLGAAGIEVSRACLGSMTWGAQNTQSDADAQIEMALDAGVNFIDTAEMYPIPVDPKNYGVTESVIGNWLSRNQHRRQQIVLASKISGPGLPYVRGGKPIKGSDIVGSVEASLKRLQTDYIDLYQIHWPNRPHPHFARHWPGMVNPAKVSPDAETEGMLDILNGLNDCVVAGKIRHVGLSDETPWGISEYIRLSESHSLPAMVSVQNEFSLLHSKDWPYLVETCAMEQVAFLPWSPIGGGVLSGKYLNGARPEGSRWTFEQRMGLIRDRDAVHSAVKGYVAIAERYGMSPAQMALAWCNQVPGVTSSIIGATNLEQLEENLSAFDIELSEACLAEISTVHRQYPSPF